MELLDKIRNTSRQLHADTVAARRYLHAHPELSFQEVETAKWVGDKLRSFGLEPVSEIGRAHV